MSETVGFVFVFSLVLLTVGTVFTIGYAGLQDARDAERINNAERAFDVLDDNIEDITVRGAPSRGTEVRLAEASIGTGESTLLSVSGYEGGSLAFSTGNYTLDPVVYESGDTRIRYSGNALTRIQPAGSVALSEPDFVLSERRAIIPVVELSVEDRSIAGSRTVLIRSQRRLRTVEVDDTDVDRLEIALSSPVADRWESYLSGAGMSCSRPGGADDPRVVCETTDLDRVQVVHFELAVTFG
ncbi:hypothetical protein JCM30237_14960 [Halolamina litorea]